MMPAPTVRRLNAAMDERLRSQKFLKEALDHIFPDNWSFMLGEAAMYCFIVLIVTGVWLAFFFDPSDTSVVYQGSYLRLHGLSMNSAYESVVHLDLDVRAGNLIRQVHHWAADLFIAAIICHQARIFFSGAFRKPRELNWMIGVTLLMLAVFNGFTGYSLPGDLMSGLGLRIAYSIVEGIPLIGQWVSYFLFGGQFPSSELEHRLYIAHVFVAPLLIAALLGVHLALIWRQKHTEFPGAGRTEKRLVGAPMWPTYTLRSVALLFTVLGVLFLLGGLVQINPVWEYGPYHPYVSSSFAQPDWYTGWLEGSLRLFPPWHLHIFGWTVSELFWSGVVIPAVTFAVMYAYPFLERWWTGDRLYHNLLDRPRNRPGRTAFGVAALTEYVLLTVAGGQDVIADLMNLQQVPFTYAMRGMCIGMPFLTGLLAWKVCRDLRGVPPEPPELPEGLVRSVMQDPDRFLPARARWQGVEGEKGTAQAPVTPPDEATPASVASALARLAGKLAPDRSVATVGDGEPTRTGEP